MELVKFQFHSSSGTELEKSGTLGPDLKKNGFTGYIQGRSGKLGLLDAFSS